MPKLAIITINYNNKAGLEKTISSVTDQTFTDFEFIIIDGGSTDGGKEIIEKNKTKISYWVSEKDRGIYEAQNKGIKAAKGEYLLFLNSGDYLADKNVLQKVFSKNVTADIAYGNIVIAHYNGEKEKRSMPAQITFNHMIADTLWHPVSFIKKSVFEKYGYYNEEFTVVADYDFFLKVLLEKKVSTQYLNEYISVFNLEGFSSKHENAALIKKERLKAQLQYFDLDKIEAAVKENSAIQNSEPSLTQKILSLFKRK